MPVFVAKDKRRVIKKILSVFLLFIFLIVNLFSFNINTARAIDPWYNINWQYRKSHTIVAAAGAGTDYQMKINVHYGSGTDNTNDVYLNSKSKTDFSDLFFAANDGTTPLPYWVQSQTDSDNAVIWVKISADVSSSNQTIYIYYGNAGASSNSNGDTTFLFFDDFSGNLSKWAVEKSSGVYPRIESGYMRAGGGNTTATIYGHTSLGSSPTYASFINGAIGFRAKNATNSIGEVAYRGNFSTNTGYKGRFDQRINQGNSFIKPPYTSGSWALLSGCIASGGSPTIDTWYAYEMTTSSSTFKMYRDGVLKNTCSDASYTSAGEIALQNHYGSYTDYDWVYVRKFVATEPTNGVWGSEEIYATVPDAPTGLTPTAGNTQVLLNWIAPANGGSPITDYVVDFKLHTAPEIDWATFADGTSTNTYATVTSLTNGSLYDFRVSAHNVVGTGSPSTTTTATPATVPDAPAQGIATKGNASASIAFIAPNDGGSPITNYTVTSSPGSFTNTGNASPIVVSGLTNGVPYTFTITATNAMGTGPASIPSDPVTPATVPGEPIAILATPGNTQVSLSWSAPVYDGDSAITDYVIEYKLTSDSIWSQFGHAPSPARTIIVTGLTNGSSYDFQISAKNDMGVGNPSTPLVSSTPRTVPSAPVITSVISGDMQVTVNFTAPYDGGAEITGYTVTSDNGGTDSNAGSTNLSHIVTGLTNGTAYTFTVTATNIAGTGPASDPSQSVTPAKAPDAPTLLIATPGNTQVSLSWAEPNNNGAPITDYLIEYKLHTDSVWTQFGHAPSPATNIIITDLVNGFQYDFQVSAYNSAGTSDPSSPPVSSTPRTVPSAPAITSVISGNGEVTINFTAPISNGGSEITSYTATSDPQGIIQTGASSPIIIGGLTNGTAYTFTVTATNIAGTGPASLPSQSVTPATVPGKPINVIAVAGDEQATISFTAPLSDGGAEITGYTVTSNDGGTDSNAGSTNLSHIVTGLTNGQTYTFTVVATNYVGAGLASDASNSITLPTAPTAPLNLAGIVKSSSIDLTWSAPASDGGSTITDYIIEYQLTTVGNWAIFNDGISTNRYTTVTGLANGTSYDFRVSAENIIGQSDVSNFVTATPGEPAQVLILGFPDLTNTSIGTDIRITNEGLIEYEYQYTWCVTDAVDNLCGGGDDVFSASNAKLIDPAEDFDFTATSTVSNPGDYFFHIKVLYGSQSSSAFQSFSAVETFPDPPTSVSAVAGNAQATISFTAPASNGGSPITNYTVTSNPGGITASGLTTPIIVTGLTNGTAYTFTMTATNIVGTGLSSSPPSNEVTPATMPGAINSLSASAGNTEVGLFWNPPTSDGGSAITDYVIEYKLSSNLIWAIFADAISTSTTITVTGLTNDLSYDFRVSAVNAIGQGPVNSTSATSVTPPPSTDTGGGNTSGSHIRPPTTVPIDTPTTNDNIEIIPETIPDTKPSTGISTKLNTKIIKNEVSITPTETSKITQPIKIKQTQTGTSENKEKSSIPWTWIIIFSIFIFVTGFIIFIIRRRMMDDQKN